MNWYVAKLVYRIIYGDGISDSQFSEQLRLVKAVDEVHAFTKAQQIGHREEQGLYSENSPLIQWRFIDVCELMLLSELADGAEIVSTICMADNPDHYLKTVRRRSSQLLAESCDKCFHQN